MWHAVLTAFPHRSFATSLLCNIALAISWMILFFLSITPFCWGVIGVENSWVVPALMQKDSNWEFLNSLSRSLRIWSTFNPFSFCTLLYNDLMWWGASDFDCSKMTQVNLVKLLTTTMMYFFPLRDSVLVGPIRSTWRSSRGLAVAVVKVAWCWAFVCFPS